MKPLIVLLVILLLVLQYKLWFAAGGVFQTVHLKHEVTQQQKKNMELNKRNTILMADVNALKSNDAAVEARARTDLGMIKDGEVFYQIVS
ncbi:MAG: cell division protein FtsB [Gammaproteobacteria bacterium]|nr:cell division protein FtsB [Gammaproteobacteria bacterium]